MGVGAPCAAAKLAISGFGRTSVFRHAPRTGTRLTDERYCAIACAGNVFSIHFNQSRSAVDTELIPGSPYR